MGAKTWKVFHISSSNWFCILLISSSWTSSIMAEKKKWPIYCDFSHFTSIIWPCGRDNLKSFSHILFKFVMYVTYNQFLDKFNNGWKKKWPIYCDFSHFTSIIWPCYLRDDIRLYFLYHNSAAGYYRVCSCYNILFISYGLLFFYARYG